MLEITLRVNLIGYVILILVITNLVHKAYGYRLQLQGSEQISEANADVMTI